MFNLVKHFQPREHNFKPIYGNSRYYLTWKNRNYETTAHMNLDGHDLKVTLRRSDADVVEINYPKNLGLRTKKWVLSQL